MRIAPMHRHLSLLLLLVLLAASPAPHAEDSQDVFGSWTLRCADQDGRPECILFQNLVLKTGGEPVLQFGVGRVPPDTQPTVLLSLPLGIALPPGVTIRIDAGTPATFPIERCEPDGCRAAMKLRDSTAQQLAQGRQLEITFYDGARKPIKVPLSLDGFGAAFRAFMAKTG